jgi:vacuolar-type H+-ATPase subunit E/Vma4
MAQKKVPAGPADETSARAGLPRQEAPMRAVQGTDAVVSALERLLAAIERRVESEAGGILEAGRQEADRVAAIANERRERRRAESTARMEAAGRLELETELLETRRDVQQRMLEARQRFLARARQALEALLVDAVGSVAYRDVLPGHLDDSLVYFGDEPAVIHCSPGIALPLRSLVAGRSQLTVREDPAVLDGFRVVSQDGTLQVDNTLHARLSSRWQSMAIELLRRAEAMP